MKWAVIFALKRQNDTNFPHEQKIEGKNTIIWIAGGIS